VSFYYIESPDGEWRFVVQPGDPPKIVGRDMKMRVNAADGSVSEVWQKTDCSLHSSQVHALVLRLDSEKDSIEQDKRVAEARLHNYLAQIDRLEQRLGALCDAAGEVVLLLDSNPCTFVKDLDRSTTAIKLGCNPLKRLTALVNQERGAK